MPMPSKARLGRSASEKVYRFCRSWLHRDTGCGAGATRCPHAAPARARLAGLVVAVVVVAVVVGAVGTSAAAQNTTTSENHADDRRPDPLAEVLAARQPRTHLPTPAEAMDAYAAAASWLRGWDDPAGFATPAAAVRVSIYERGRLVGESSALAEHAGPDGPLAVATAGAMARARRVVLPRGGAIGDELMAELAADLTLSVELAGPFTPLSVVELLNPAAEIQPGLTGIAARTQAEWAFVFPSELAASGTAPGVKLAAMAASLLGEPTLGVELLTDLAQHRGVSFYRFEVVHVAGVGGGVGMGAEGSPVFLTRGNRIVEQNEVTTASLIRFAEGMVGHIAATRIGGDAGLGLMGTINGARGNADPAVAAPMQQALVALALVRLAQTQKMPAATRDRARSLALAIVKDLARVEPGEFAPAEDGVAAAVLWVVLTELGTTDAPELRALLETCESMLAAHAAAVPVERQGTVSDAVLVWALAERAARTGRDREFAERELRSLVRQTPRGGMVGLMPWIGWAELTLAGDEGPIPSAVVLREARDVVWTHQLTLRDTGAAERDLRGGIVFTAGGLSLPTWNTARPVAFLATMLGDPRLTTAQEMPGEVGRLIDAMRFLQQLSAGEAVCAFSPRPELVRGGIRAAVWDPRQPPEATALTLLAVVELLDSLDTLEEAARARADGAREGDARSGAEGS